MKQESLLSPPRDPKLGDVRVMIHNGKEWLDLSESVKTIEFVSYNAPFGGQLP